MKKIISQITAFALAICMLAALVPAVPAQAAETDEPTTVTLNFTDYTGFTQIGGSGNYYSIPSVNNLSADTWKGGWSLNETLTSATYMTYLNSTAANSSANNKNWNAMYGASIRLNLNQPSGSVALDFNVEKAGYYALKKSGFENMVDAGNIYSGKVKISVKNGVGVTTEFGTVDTSVEPVVYPESNIVYLTSGKNTLLLAAPAGTATTAANRVMITEVTFTETSSSQPKMVMLNFLLTDYFATIDNTTNAITGTRRRITAVTDNTLGNWLLNSGLTLDAYENRMNSTKASDCNWNCLEVSGLVLDLDIAGDVAFDFEVSEAGYYALSEVVIKNNNCATNIHVKNGDGDITLLGSAVKSATNTDKSTITENLGGAYLTAGTNTLLLSSAEPGDAGDDDRTYFESFTFTETDEPQVVIPSSEIFGDTYAYVKDGKLFFVGGLKTIANYTEVGFEVSVDDVKKSDISTNKVYKSFTIGAEEYTAEKEFGVGADGYIFITEFGEIPASGTIKIKPYVAKGEDKTYHADDLVLELTI